MTILDLLDATTQRFPDRPLLGIDPTTPDSPDVITYSDARRTAVALAAALAAHGVRAGSRVAVALPGGADLVHLWFAVAATGAVLVPMDPRLTDPELADLVTRADPVLTILPADRSVPEGIGCPVIAGVPEPGVAGEFAPVQVDPHAPAVVLYTSGSTGAPKGCVLTHDSFVLPAGHMVDRLRLTPDDALLHVLPLHHMAGLSFLATGVAAGARVALVDRFSGSRFWRQATACGATVFRHLGEMLAVLCARPHEDAERTHRLRLAYGAGATPAVAATFRDRFDVPTLEGYGASETNTVLCGDIDDPRPGTLGRPLPHVRVRLVDDDGYEVPGPGSGELRIGPNPALMLGYLNAPDTAAALHDGWYRTGDLVRRDEAGELRFVRRIGDVIRRRGENIDPTEIERAAESCAGVRRAAAIGVADEIGGIDIKLYLEPLPGETVSADEVRTHCAGQLATFKRPRYVQIIDRLPLTATQKVDKVALRRLDTAARQGGSR